MVDIHKMLRQTLSLIKTQTEQLQEASTLKSVVDDFGYSYTSVLVGFIDTLVMVSVNESFKKAVLDGEHNLIKIVFPTVTFHLSLDNLKGSLKYEHNVKIESSGVLSDIFSPKDVRELIGEYNLIISREAVHFPEYLACKNLLVLGIIENAISVLNKLDKHLKTIEEVAE